MHEQTEFASLVGQIEKKLANGNFGVDVRAEEGGVNLNSLSEFEAVIQGQVEVTSFKWLVVCKIFQEGEFFSEKWLRQVIARRERLGGAKTKVVVSVPFSRAVAQLAFEQGIALKVVRDMDMTKVGAWFPIPDVYVTTQQGELNHASPVVADYVEETLRDALVHRVADIQLREPLLITPESNEVVSMHDVWGLIMDGPSQEQFFAGLSSKTVPRSLRLRAKYPESDYRYGVATDAGLVGVDEIWFYGTLSVCCVAVPLAELDGYVTQTQGSSYVSLRFSHERAAARSHSQAQKFSSTYQSTLVLRAGPAVHFPSAE